MHVTGDLGPLSLVLVVSLVVPVIAFVIRRKWRLSVARKEEIKRLLVLASEEAARAELEATYGAVSVQWNSYQCAVCYCPTTTRCARCKAVRYCSGKCQIIHWRQGHKDECHPPSNTFHINNDGSNSGGKVAKQDQHDLCSDRYEKSPIETSSTEPALSSSNRCSGVPILKDDGAKVDSVSDAEGKSPISESSGTSFSGFSTSLAGGELSDDVSISESISSNETEVSDGQVAADIGPDMLESSSKVAETKPLSPKFASLVDSVDSFTKSNKLKHTEPQGNDHATSSLAQSDSVTCESPIPGKVSSGFWDRTVDTISSNDAQHGPTGADNVKSRNSESFLHFKFNLSESNAPSLHEKSKEATSSIMNELPAAAGIIRPINRAVILENTGANVLKGRSSPSMSFERPYCVDNGFIGDSNVSESSDSKSISSSTPSADRDLPGTDASQLHGSPSLSSQRSNLFVNKSVSSLPPSKSQISTSASQTILASNASAHSVPSEKFGKVDNLEINYTPSSQMGSSSSNSITGLKSSVRKVVDQFRGPKSGRYNDKGLFPYDLFVKLYTSNKEEMQPCGLINCGNSCYANAVLQCLAFTPPLTTYFVQGLHSKECVNKEWCFTCEFENLIFKAKEGKSPLSPAGILSQLQGMGSHLGNGREEDAHEFLRYAIDTMQSVCLKEAGGNASGSFEEETSLIGLTFGGYLRSKIKCMKCQHKSERQERMMDLTVEIGGDIEKLEEALKRFTGTEILDGDNKYQCSRCKSYEKAKKKLTILEAPNVLTIALKRFQSGKFGKLNKSIRFPEILDLAPYMSGTSDKSPIYRLYGVVVHLDIMNAAFSGHYVCYVKNIQNKWFKIDDSTVTAVELERVLTKGAYILLYARCSPRAPRLLRNGPSRVIAKNTALNSGSTSTRSSDVSISQDNLASVESFYLKFHRLQRILEEDSSSDNFSFTSSNSDEGSCSTDSTRDSISNDDLSDYIFGGWNSSRRSMSDSDTSSSSSSSPLYWRQSPLSDLDRKVSSSPQTRRSQTKNANSQMEDGDFWGGLPNPRNQMADSGGDSFLHSDTSNQCRKLASSSSHRETSPEKLGRPLNDVKSGISFRRSVSERTN